MAESEAWQADCDWKLLYCFICDSPFSCQSILFMVWQAMVHLLRASGDYFWKKREKDSQSRGAISLTGSLSLFLTPSQPHSLTCPFSLSLSLSLLFVHFSCHKPLTNISPEAESTTVLMLLQAEGGHELWVSWIWHSSSWAGSCWKVFCLQVQSERQDLRTWKIKVVGKRVRDLGGVLGV